MATLLLAEVQGGKLNDATAKGLTAAVALGAPVHVLVASVDTRPPGGTLRDASGAERRTIVATNHPDTASPTTT